MVSYDLCMVILYFVVDTQKLDNTELGFYYSFGYFNKTILKKNGKIDKNVVVLNFYV